MIFELKIWFIWGVIGVFEKLRVITAEDADRERDRLVLDIRIKRLSEREG